MSKGEKISPQKRMGGKKIRGQRQKRIWKKNNT